MPLACSRRCTQALSRNAGGRGILDTIEKRSTLISHGSNEMRRGVHTKSRSSFNRECSQDRLGRRYSLADRAKIIGERNAKLAKLPAILQPCAANFLRFDGSDDRRSTAPGRGGLNPCGVQERKAARSLRSHSRQPAFEKLGGPPTALLRGGR